MSGGHCNAQSRQSARLILQSSELEPPPPCREVFLPSLVPGGGHTRWGERGGGPNSDEGTDTLVL
jgi:hypothetical protein